MTAVQVCAVSDLREYVPLRVELERIDVAVVRVGAEVFAIEDVCSHADVPLSDGDVEIEDGVCTIECALHGSRFDLTTGKPTGPPASMAVPVYPVEIIDDIVYLKLENG
ncbi:MAG: sufE [Pseudonocardiales bacterium]|nr:sufE [Pseudonocardiales bacterium]